MGFPKTVSQTSNVKLEIDSRTPRRSDPACPLCLIFRRNASEVSLDPMARIYRGYLSRFYLPRGADRQKRQIALRAALRGIRLPLFDRHAIKRLRINEPGTNISANSPEVNDTSGRFTKSGRFFVLLFFSLLLRNIYYIAIDVVLPS